jgi:hypothetical protein
MANRKLSSVFFFKKIGPEQNLKKKFNSSHFHIRTELSLPAEEPYLDSYCARGEKKTPQSCDLHGALHSSI